MALSPISIPPITTVAELSNTVTFILNNLINAINNSKPDRDQDINGKRLTNVGFPSQPSDAVNITYLDNRLRKQFSHLKNSTIQFVNSQLEDGVQSIVGTHLERGSYDPLHIANGSLFYETDRTTFYQVQNGIWIWVNGLFIEELANIPTDLGADDEGFLFYASDYAHTWRWDGSAWAYAPGDRVSGEFAYFSADPGVGWAMCDGSSVTRTLTDATTASITLPDAQGVYIKAAAAYSNATVLASAPTLTGSVTSASAGTPSGTVTSTFAGGSVATGPPSATTLITQGTSGSVSVASSGHTHDVSLAGTVASTFVGDPLTAHNHTDTFAVDDDGEPTHINIPLYFRL
jgi:hypothetical protein